jgi:hypothetical protein
MASTPNGSSPTRTSTSGNGPSAPSAQAKADPANKAKGPEAKTPESRVDLKPAAPVDPAARAAKAKALEAAVGQIEKNYGKGSIMRLDNEAIPVIPAISCGALSLDLALGGRRSRAKWATATLACRRGS